MKMWFAVVTLGTCNSLTKAQAKSNESITILQYGAAFLILIKST